MKKAHLTCGLVVGALALAGCGFDGGSSGAADDTAGHIVIDEPFGPAAGWALETDDAFVLSKAGCLETLVRYATDGSLRPMLAESWKQTAPTVWEVKLRSGVTFQDGTKLDAQAVAGALDHLLGVKAPSKSFPPTVIGGVQAAGADTVRVTTKKPDVLLPYRLANPNTGILAPKAYQGDSIEPKGACTGPFAITEEIPQQALKLKRNDSYWGSKAKIATAEVRFIPDGATRATQVRSGEAQIGKRLPVASVQALQGNDRVKIETAETSRVTELLLNNKRAPLSDTRVRQAIQAAIDTKAINDGVYAGGARPAVGPFAPSEPWAPKGAAPVAADASKARSLLSQAGVKPASIKLTLLAYTEGPQFADLAAVIQEQLKKIGFKVKIKTGDYPSLEPSMLDGDYDMALLSRNSLGDVADPAGFLINDYTCDGEYNLSHFCDPALDALVTKATGTADAEQRYALYAQAAEQLQSRAVDVFLLHETQSDAVATTVRNFTIHPYYTLTADLAVSAER